MRVFQYIPLIAILLITTPAIAQKLSPIEELFGACTEREDALLDRASAEYADIMYPEKRDKKYQEKRKRYYKKMEAPGITEKLMDIYLRCDRDRGEFFNLERMKEQLESGS